MNVRTMQHRSDQRKSWRESSVLEKDMLTFIAATCFPEASPANRLVKRGENRTGAVLAGPLAVL